MLAIGPAGKGLLPSPMEMGELVKTRWVSASGGDVGVELTAVVSIVMVGLWRYCVSMYTGPRCEAYTYARCLRTPEGFSSWSGEAMVAEAVGLGHKRATQPQTRRSSILEGTLRPIARPMGWRRVCAGGAEGRAKAEGRDREAACRGPQRLAAAATRLVSLRLCLWGCPATMGMAKRQSQSRGCMGGRSRLRVFRGEELRCRVGAGGGGR